MKNEQKGNFQFAGKDVTIIGENLQAGQKAPEFKGIATDWSVIRALKSTRGKVRIIGSLPSLSTSVCDRETRRFNEEAVTLGGNVVIIMLSMDLPFTTKNWCASAGIDKVVVLSDHKWGEFGKKYAVLIKEPRVLRRAIFVVDQHDQLIYVAYMPKIGDEPNYQEVLEIARKALVTVKE